MVQLKTFDKAVDMVILLETGGDPAGGYTNDPRDPGGETRWGISKRAFPREDIKALSRAKAVELYREHYWLPLRPDEFAAPLAIVLFDIAVNQGAPTAIRLLQKACGVAQDGVMGPNTIAAANRLKDAVARLSAERAIRYASTANFDAYARGWLRRAFTVALEAYA
ncbi:zliS Lysozyme family protein [uncultured Caudovirales phage]|uniref:ZliS Lysozyme family protein n=1 Tax=uncultured Caudovirales phage TaxID=2100421 RepID=A0A6J7WEU5_9CAUD|nr:zliS Lysozyme family protein [uncultured Caudovirales phage]